MDGQKGRCAVSLRTLAGLCLALVAVSFQFGAARPAVIAATANLVRNGGFESKLGSWNVCGGVGLGDTLKSGKTVAATGRYAARMGNPTRGTCPSAGSFSDDPYQALSQGVTVPGNVPALTLSFWYAVDAKVGGTMEVGLAEGLSSGWYEDSSAMMYGPSGVERPGWQEFRHVFTADELASVKGKRLLLIFRLLYPLTLAEKQTFRIDDVRLLPAAIRTVVSARPPAALKGDGTRRLAFIRDENAGGVTHSNLWLMDTDGTKGKRLYEGLLWDLDDPEWSPTGQALAVIDETFENNAPKGGISLVDPVTGEGQLLTQFPTGSEDFAQVYDGITWSPNGRLLAVSAFAYDPGGTVGLATIKLVNVATGKSTESIDYATNPDWGKNNRLLFEGYDLLEQDREWGIWDARMTSAKPATHAVLPGSLSWADEAPVWAPDGKHFVTIRSTAGQTYVDGNWRTNQALMLFDRSNIRAGRMLLLADNGYLRDPAFSPDGTFVIYTLVTDRGKDIWWLNVATGATGPLTRDGISYDADWRP